MCRELCPALDREGRREHPDSSPKGGPGLVGSTMTYTGLAANVHIIISCGTCNEGKREVVRESQEPSYRVDSGRRDLSEQVICKPK